MLWAYPGTVTLEEMGRSLGVYWPASLASWWLFCCVFVFQGRVSLGSSPDYPGTLSLDQAGFELRDPPACFPHAGIKGVCHYHTSQVTSFTMNPGVRVQIRVVWYFNPPNHLTGPWMFLKPFFCNYSVYWSGGWITLICSYILTPLQRIQYIDILYSVFHFTFGFQP